MALFGCRELINIGCMAWMIWMQWHGEGNVGTYCMTWIWNNFHFHNFFINVKKSGLRFTILHYYSTLTKFFTKKCLVLADAKSILIGPELDPFWAIKAIV